MNNYVFNLMEDVLILGLVELMLFIWQTAFKTELIMVCFLLD